MRLFAAAIISICLLGGLSVYIHLKAQWRPAAPSYEPPPAAGVYALEITPSFSPERDPFAQDVDDTQDAPAILRVSLGGRVLVAEGGAIEAGKVIRVDAVEGIQVGKNHFLLVAAVPDDKLTGSHAVRIRILRDGVQVADQTVWSEPGHPVSGEVTLVVAPFDEVEESHDHD